MNLLKVGELIRSGSAKDIYRIDEKSIAFRFTDHFSVFDVGRSKDEIPGKARAVCACAVKSAQIAEKIGVPTNFIEQIDSATIRVHEARIIKDRYCDFSDENYLVPAECIYRLFVAGSIDRDFRSGKKKPEDYGLDEGAVPETGTPFPFPVHMFTTKFEKIDRDITDEQMCKMAGMTLKDRDQFWSMIDRITGAIGLELSGAGLSLVDGKFECIMGFGRKKIIGDVFGTPDEDRFCNASSLKQGKLEHYSKEYIRQHFISTGYYSELQTARQNNKPDPPLPKLPEEVVEEISRRYAAVANAYAQTKIS